MHFTIGLRLSEEEEVKGSDYVEHGIKPVFLPIQMEEAMTDKENDEEEPFFHFRGK